MRLTGVVFIGLAVLTLGILSCQDGASSRPVAGDVIVRELAAKYQAITGWEENLTYTLQAQERLITDKPILFRGHVDDVFNRQGKTFVRLSSFVLSPFDFVFELECSRSHVETILRQESGGSSFERFFDEYAVVANIQAVSKPVIALQASAISEDEAVIDIDSSRLLIARGSCIAIAHIPRPKPR